MPEPVPEQQDRATGARSTGVWVFGLTNLPYGIITGYTAIAVPALLRQAQVSVLRISEIEALLMLPLAWQFLYGPLIDLAFRRRNWLIVTSAVSTALAAGSLLLPLPRALDAYVACCVLAQAIGGLVNSCNGGLIATTASPSRRGSASGWLYAAAIAGNVAGGGLVLWLCRVAGPAWAAGVLAVVCFAPALGAVWIPETYDASRRGLRALGRTLGETWQTLRSPLGWSGMLFSLSPIGSAALVNLFAGLGPDYRASPASVEFVNAYWGGVGPALGALLAGRMLDHMHKRTGFILTGLLTAAVDAAMAFCPQTPTVYALGVGAYLLTIGFSYAAFSAVVLEVIGRAEASAGAQFTLYTAAGNMASSYAIWLDGRGYDLAGHHGVAPMVGMLSTDAALNVVGALVLVGFFLPGRRTVRTAPQGAAT